MRDVLFHSHIRRQGDLLPRSRRDEDELSPNGISGSEHLVGYRLAIPHTYNGNWEPGTYKHVDGHFAIDVVHIDIAAEYKSANARLSHHTDLQLIQAANRGPHGLPQS